MTDIPDDLKAIGLSVLVEAMHDGTPDAGNIIAAAILAERNRCADIADDECAGVDDGDYWIAQRIRDRILGKAEVYDPLPRRTEDGCLSHLPQGGGTDSPATQIDSSLKEIRDGRAMTDIVEELKDEAVRISIMQGGDRVSSRDVTSSVIFKGALEIDSLRSSLKEIREENDRLKGERDEARQKLFPYADATEISGISWDGMYLIGDKKSVAYFHEMQNRGQQIDVYKRAFDERTAAAESSCEAMAKALEPFSKAGRVIDGPFGPALFAKDDMAFQSGCAWSENGERKTITWGDFRTARTALDAYRKEKGND